MIKLQEGDAIPAENELATMVLDFMRSYFGVKDGTAAAAARTPAPPGAQPRPSSSPRKAAAEERSVDPAPGGACCSVM